MSVPLYLTADLRRMEESARGATPPLMERAGAAAAALAARIAGERAKDVLVLAGPGDNGGDARIVASLLRERFFRVALATRPDEIPAERRWALVVDGLFGIGLSRPIAGDYARMVEHANRQRCPVLALDVPSGLDADTGALHGVAVRATHTLTFLSMKPGLLMQAGPDHAGEITVADLDVATAGVRPQAWVADRELFASVLRPRPRNFHKGMAGTAGVLGGAPGMTGASLLAGRAALKLGAGKVRVGFLADDAPSFDAVTPELMLSHADEVLGTDLDALVAGPGLGTSETADALLGATLASDIPCVVDADGLNLLAQSERLQGACERRRAETILTPHPAEAGRLLGIPTAEVQADRIAAARRIATRYNAHTVLKGTGSVIVARDGHWFVNASGNPGLSTAGTGDVLAGILGALLAQRLTGESSAVLGTHLHGCAADELVRDGIGPVGLTAGELVDSARRVWNRWLRDRPALADPSDAA
ncbi:MAG TPA: NAD(P)H-hydrate dehydratase [Burkholderiales bacterium]|nr:NAD(P)H-hydrate dehydratase [Burkholderiales bacterium]